MTVTNDTEQHDPKALWHLGSMNDGRFIINTPPRPSTDDVVHDRADGPTLALPVHALPQAQAQAIVDEHNAAVTALVNHLGMLVDTKLAHFSFNSRSYEFEAGRLVKIDGARVEQMTGNRLIGLVRELATRIAIGAPSLPVNTDARGWLYEQFDEHGLLLRSKFSTDERRDDHPFGRPGVDFSDEYRVNATPMAPAAAPTASRNEREASDGLIAAAYKLRGMLDAFDESVRDETARTGDDSRERLAAVRRVLDETRRTEASAVSAIDLHKRLSNAVRGNV